MIREFYEGRTILLTGGTGFYGQGLLAKLLRSLPGIRRIYLPIRRGRRLDGSVQTVDSRLSDLFKTSAVFAPFRLEDPMGFAKAIERAVAVESDMLEAGLGLATHERERMVDELDLIISCAATVSFDDPLDHSLRLNTLAPCEIMELARECRRSPVLLHVSTAYVNGRRTGDIPEEPLSVEKDIVQAIGQGGNDLTYDVESEIEDGMLRCKEIRSSAMSQDQQSKFRQHILDQSRSAKLSDSRIQKLLKGHTKRWVENELIQEGMRRAEKHGWHDVYTYTKGMGEQLLQKRRGQVPLVILRPSVTESSVCDPEPGWIHGLKVTDPLVIAYGRGLVPDFPAQRGAPMDLIPIDIVVNAILIAATQGNSDGVKVYHAASSGENPLFNTKMFEYAQSYFRKYPLLAKDGSIPELVDWTFPSVNKFRFFFRWRYMYPLAMRQWILDKMPESHFVSKKKRRLKALKTRLNRILYFVDLFSPYTTLDCRFQMRKMLSLYDSLSSEERKIFNVDVRSIDWKHYYQETHLPGLRRHVLKSSDDSGSTFR
ncbi:MAG: SDR family oxidoreductase [Candidatus Latescibacterota bacterium]|nr:SDR family oxidoreductase [Candidatus Latescibacterota bacterium]